MNCPYCLDDCPVCGDTFTNQAYRLRTAWVTLIGETFGIYKLLDWLESKLARGKDA